MASEGVGVRRAAVNDAAAIAALSAELGYPAEPGDIQRRLRISLQRLFHRQADDGNDQPIAEIVGPPGRRDRRDPRDDHVLGVTRALGG